MKTIIIILISISIYSCNKGMEVNKHTFESDDTNYYNGEILYPDYVHSDTLIVMDSKLLNWCMEKYDIGSDGDINDILIATTKKLNIQNYKFNYK